MKRYPPRIDKSDPTPLDYDGTTRQGIRRRPHPVFFPLALAFAALLTIGAMIWVIKMAIVWTRGAGQD